MSQPIRLRYDFLGDKIDVSRFQKHLKHYVSHRYFDIGYDIYFENYKLNIFIDTYASRVFFSLEKLIKNINKDIINVELISVPDDVILHNCNDINKFYDLNKDHRSAEFNEPDADKLVDNLVNIVKTIFKIDNLKLFV